MNKTETFIEKARAVHGDKYDYSKVEYINAHTKVCIICPIHGEFLIRPNNHLNGQGCSDCGGTKKLNTKSFIQKAMLIYGDKYDYSKVEYKNNKTKVCITCPIHGDFWMRPNDHLNYHGCPDCGGTKKLTNNEVKHRFNEIHGDKYDYSKVEYVDANTKVCIICPKHGEFWQPPHDHLKGCGCPTCNESALEKHLFDFLTDRNISFKSQKKFNWLGKQRLDFYIPKYNIAIECQGIQHFENRDFFEPLEIIQERDKLKKQLCEEHGIKVLYYSNLDIEYPYHVFTSKEELLKEITK